MAKRLSSAQRGYGHDWRKFRAAFLKKNPMCCRQGCREIATDVDHEPPLTGPDDPGRLDESRCAPLCHAHHSQKTGKQTSAKYADHREAMAEKSREKSKAGRDIGPLPDVKHPKRKKSCGRDLKLFCETYLPDRFNLGWSDDHIKVLSKMQLAVLTGGLFALAMPRGSGKSTITEAASLWAILYGHRKFVVIIGATADAAVELMDSVRVAVESNDLLLEDFPEACYPVRCLEGIATRARGQILDGERTCITWTDKKIVFPTVPKSKSSGARIYVAGIDGRIRGMKAALPDGSVIRPDFAIADDPQTDESAASIGQVDKNERRLLGAIKGLAGPGKTISMVIPCTVINPGDLSQRLLDRKRNPQFQGEHMKLVYKFPDDEEKWKTYNQMRKDSLASDGDGSEATELYRNDQEAMRRGAVIAWEARYDAEVEVDALQAAMNILCDNPREFWAEYQNEPMLTALGEGARRIEPAWVMARLNGLPQCVVPRDCGMVTTFVDPGGYLIWWATVAWAQDFGGSVIDYGVWPPQVGMFKKENTSRNLAARFPNKERRQYVYAGLQEVMNQLVNKQYVQDMTHVVMKTDQFLIDCGFENEVVYDFIREFPGNGAKIMASQGEGRTKTRRALGKWEAKPGEIPGFNWLKTTTKLLRGYQIKYDTDFWKGFVYERVATAMGGNSLLKVFGINEDGKRPDHTLFASHMSAEYGHLVEHPGGEFEKWEPVPPEGELNNDWFDCVVGCAVAASANMLKWQASESFRQPARNQKPISLRELQERRRREKAGVA